MSLDSLVDKLGQAPSKSMSMKQAVQVLKECPTFRELVVKTNHMSKQETDEVFHAIAVLKAGIVKNAFNENTDSEDMKAFSEWEELVLFVDTLMDGLSGA